MTELPRDLSLSPALRAALRRLRDALGVTAATDVEVRDLAEVEAFVSSVVPDAVIALLVAQGKTIGTIATETSLHRDLASTWEPAISQREREALVCFDHWGEHPLFTVGYRRTKDRGEPHLVVWDHKKWVAVPEFGLDDVVRYVEGRYRGIHRDDDRGPLALDLAGPPGPDDETFRPRLVATVLKERWVEHPKFGRGKVLREVDGRVEVAFADATRTLLARFVRDA